MTMNFQDPIAGLLGGWSAEVNAYSIILRLAIAVAFSAVIGCERASKRHAAGLRTFILVCMASATAMIIDMSLGKFPVISAAAVIAVAIVSSNSILFSAQSQIKGLTTSMGLWASGILGLTVGAGMYTLAIVGFLAQL